MDSRLRLLMLAAGIALIGYFLLHRNDHANSVVLASRVPPPDVATRPAPERLVPLHTPALSVQASTYSGTLATVDLTADQFHQRDAHGNETPVPIRLTTTQLENYQHLASNVVFERNDANVLPAYLTYDVASSDDHAVVFHTAPPGTDVEVTRSIRAQDPYSFAVDTRVVNHGAPGRLRFAEGVYHYVRTADDSGGFFRQPWQRSEGLCRHHGDRLFREWREDLEKNVATRPGGDGIANQAVWVGVSNLYFLQALLPVGDEPAACLLRSEPRGFNEAEPEGHLLYGELAYAPVNLATNETHTYTTAAYLGPKLSATLAAASPALSNAVNLGTFSIIARGLLWLLRALHGVVHNWGVAIMLLTLIVRTALYPVMATSMKSMAAMQRLKPEIDAAGARFPDDPEQKQLAVMEVYRKHGINPAQQVLGCLPQLLQLPIWWALYTTLQTSVELFHAPFAFWLKDLSAPDPFFVLPLILGSVMFAQQKLMPPSMPDPVQQKMMTYFFPLFLTGISLFLPAGLGLYMLVNSVLAMFQQRIVKSQTDKLAAAMSGGGTEIGVRSIGPDALPPGSTRKDAS